MTQTMSTREPNGPIKSSDVPAPASGELLKDRFTSDEVFLRLVATAREELGRSWFSLLVSGIAAGLTAAVSLLASVPVIAGLGDGPAAELAGAMTYGLGFVLIVVGRYQLFTENTLTPVMLVLHRRSGLGLLLRLWGLVLLGNLIGASAMGAMLYYSGVFDPEESAHILEVTRRTLDEGWPRLLWASAFAGGLVASMMWLVVAVRESTARILIVLSIAAVIPIARLHHCVFGTTETLYAVFSGNASLIEYGRFLSLSVLGNTIGGVVFVAVINFAQTSHAQLDDNLDQDDPSI